MLVAPEVLDYDGGQGQHVQLPLTTREKPKVIHVIMRHPSTLPPRQTSRQVEVLIDVLRTRLRFAI